MCLYKGVGGSSTFCSFCRCSIFCLTWFQLSLIILILQHILIPQQNHGWAWDGYCTCHCQALRRTKSCPAFFNPEETLGVQNQSFLNHFVEFWGSFCFWFLAELLFNQCLLGDYMWLGHWWLLAICLLNHQQTNLGGGFKYFFYFQPYLGKIPILTNIFQMGWNHEPTNWLTGWCWERSPHDLQLLPNKPTAAGNTQRLMTRKTGRLAEHFCRQMNACWVAEELCVQIWFWDDPIISIVGAIQIDQFPTSFSWNVYILLWNVFYIWFCWCIFVMTLMFLFSWGMTLTNALVTCPDFRV